MGKAKKRDPNKPKRALTAFMFFSKMRRPQVKLGEPHLSFPDIAVKLGKEWNGMDAAARAPFDKAAEDDKVRYKTAMVGYTVPPEYSKKNKRKDPNKPKRAISAYLYFCKALRASTQAEYPDKNMVEIQKILGQKWAATDDQARFPFHKQAEADRERYDQEMLQMVAQKNSKRKTVAKKPKGRAQTPVEEFEEEEDDPHVGFDVGAGTQGY